MPDARSMEIKVHAAYPEKDVWAYTGYTWEQLISGTHRVSLPETVEMLSLIDILVDGPFIQEKKDIRLHFRGSDNQRVIDAKRSLASGIIQTKNDAV